MKNILVFLIFFVSFFSFSQTMDETVNWLNINLEGYGDPEFFGTYQIEVRTDTNNRKYLIFTKKTWSRLLSDDYYDYYSFKPDAIDLIYLSSKDRTNNTLDIFIKSKFSRIRHTNEEKWIKEISISMKNGHNDMAERLQTGLLHLFELLGNKIEKPKDLFKN